MKFFCSLKETHSRCSFRGQLFLALSASCLALAVTCFIAWTRAEEEQVAAALAPEVLRFHVLADSNSPDDQALKLQVRDLLLKEIRQGISGCSGKAQIQSYITANETKLEQTANELIKDQGFSCTADIRLEKAYFPTRVYGNLTFPCGIYDSVRVVLGSGSGHNWWCVLYPSLCFTSESFVVMPPESETELSGLLDEGIFEELHRERNLVFGESLGRSLTKSQDSSQNKKASSSQAENPENHVKIVPDFYFLRWIRD